VDLGDVQDQGVARQHAERLVELLTEALHESSDPDERRSLRSELIELHRELGGAGRPRPTAQTPGTDDAAPGSNLDRHVAPNGEAEPDPAQPVGPRLPEGIDERVVELIRSQRSEAELAALVDDADPVVSEIARQQRRMKSDHPLDRVGSGLARWWNQDEQAYVAMAAVEAVVGDGQSVAGVVPPSVQPPNEGNVTASPPVGGPRRRSREQFWSLWAAVFAGNVLGFLTHPSFLAVSLIVGVPLVQWALVGRLRDAGHPGSWAWMQLVPVVGVIVLLSMTLQPSEAGANRWGQPPVVPGG
jgi:hypothetical protein